jgi:hypothetical protein
MPDSNAKFREQPPETPSTGAPIMVFYDTEFTDFDPNADLLSIGMVEAKSGTELYIEISDANLSASSGFVRETVLPLFGKHSPQVLPRTEAASRIEEWLSDLRNGQTARPIQLISDSLWDWKLLLGLNTGESGESSWANRLNVECRLILSVLGPESQAETFADTIEQFYRLHGDQHHALVDARALREAWRLSCRAP